MKIYTLKESGNSKWATLKEVKIGSWTFNLIAKKRKNDPLLKINKWQ